MKKSHYNIHLLKQIFVVPIKEYKMGMQMLLTAKFQIRVQIAVIT